MNARSVPQTGRFDARQLLEDILSTSGTTASQNAASLDADAEQSDDEEDDFMSDKFLAVNEKKQPLTYAQKRHKIETRQRSSSSVKRNLRERELDARREGLDRDLLAEAEIIAGRGTLPPPDKDGNTQWDLLPEHDRAEGGVFQDRDDQGMPIAAIGAEGGTTKAMKMMLAMGYKRGQALGKPEPDVAEQDTEEEEEDTDDSDASSNNSAAETEEREKEDTLSVHGDEYLAGDISVSHAGPKHVTLSTKTVQQPIELDERWLGVNKRAGIGMIPKTVPSVVAAIRTASVQAQLQQDHEQHRQEQDFRTRASQAHQERHSQNLLVRARKTLADLDTSLLDVEYSPLWLDSALYLFLSGQSKTADPTSAYSGATLDDRMQQNPATKEAYELLQQAFSSKNLGQVDEAKTFCLLPVHIQLDLILEQLRHTHLYCLFCGCKYQDIADLERHCPGRTEADHD